MKTNNAESKKIFFKAAVEMFIHEMIPIVSTTHFNAPGYTFTRVL